MLIRSVDATISLQANVYEARLIKTRNRPLLEKSIDFETKTRIVHSDGKGETTVRINKASETTGKKLDAKCFVATACYGPQHPNLDVLRAFRDGFLKAHSAGRFFVKAYYQRGPSWAEFVGKREFLKSILRKALDLGVDLLRLFGFE